MADRIVIVDDEKEIADVIELYLKNEGYEVHKFYNGKEALSCINITVIFATVSGIRAGGAKYPQEKITAG